MKVLVADRLDAAALERLTRAGLEVIERTGLSGAALIGALAGVEAIVIRGATKVTAEVLRGAPSLRAVVRAGTGLDNVDLEAARAQGVFVSNTPEANVVSVAELTLGMLLALERHLAPASRDLSRGVWEKTRYMGRELAGRRLGLVGFGRIAREVATRARAFGMAVSACDPLLESWPAEFAWVERQPLDVLLAEADVVSIHVPLTPQTRGMLGTAELATLKPDAVLVNCSRGGVVDELALVGALRSGALRGAAIDVFETEPPGAHPLLELPNVLATPHLGASTAEAQARAGIEAAEIVIRALGEPRPARANAASSP
jgi:D-3-phosphoglycerate dehydrogenase